MAGNQNAGGGGLDPLKSGGPSPFAQPSLNPTPPSNTSPVPTAATAPAGQASTSSPLSSAPQVQPSSGYSHFAPQVPDQLPFGYAPTAPAMTNTTTQVGGGWVSHFAAPAYSAQMLAADRMRPSMWGQQSSPLIDNRRDSITSTAPTAAQGATQIYGVRHENPLAWAQDENMFFNPFAMPYTDGDGRDSIDSSGASAADYAEKYARMGPQGLGALVNPNWDGFR